MKHFPFFLPVIPLLLLCNLPAQIFYKVGPSSSTWWGELKTSEDGGNTWSAARKLPDGIYGPIKNKPVQLPNGDLLCPTSNETDEKPSKWAICFERSSDLGKTWARTELLHDGLAVSAIQPSILFPGGDKLQAVGRTRQGTVFQISSDDAGKTWGKISLTELPNPNSGTDAVTLADGRHLLNDPSITRRRVEADLAVFSEYRNKYVGMLEACKEQLTWDVAQYATFPPAPAMLALIPVPPLVSGCAAGVFLYCCVSVLIMAVVGAVGFADGTISLMKSVPMFSEEFENSRSISLVTFTSKHLLEL